VNDIVISLQSPRLASGQRRTQCTTCE